MLYSFNGNFHEIIFIQQHYKCVNQEKFLVADKINEGFSKKT